MTLSSGYLDKGVLGAQLKSDSNWIIPFLCRGYRVLLDGKHLKVLKCLLVAQIFALLYPLVILMGTSSIFLPLTPPHLHQS